MARLFWLAMQSRARERTAAENSRATPLPDRTGSGPIAPLEGQGRGSDQAKRRIAVPHQACVLRMASRQIQRTCQDWSSPVRAAGRRRRASLARWRPPLRAADVERCASGELRVGAGCQSSSSPRLVRDAGPVSVSTRKPEVYHGPPAAVRGLPRLGILSQISDKLTESGQHLRAVLIATSRNAGARSLGGGSAGSDASHDLSDTLFISSPRYRAGRKAASLWQRPVVPRSGCCEVLAWEP